jgi:hypothetical protein
VEVRQLRKDKETQGQGETPAANGGGGGTAYIYFRDPKQYPLVLLTYLAREGKSEIQVFTVAILKIIVLWDVAPCSLAGIDRRFRDAYCFHYCLDDILFFLNQCL